LSVNAQPESAGRLQLRVELRAARLPWIGWLAWHYWFVIRRVDREDRWEVWQRAGAGGVSWGHLHCNLLPAERGVGGGASWLVQQWEHDAASALAARIESSPKAYPYKHHYRYWPGPNSNTYAQWVLGGDMALAWRGHGRGYVVPG
jgi:hypothetical protein